MLLSDYVSSAPISSDLKERIRGLLPRRFKNHTIHAGPLMGCSIYTSWHDYPGAILGRTEKPLVEWFRQNVRPSQTWIDIGAHYGYTAIALARLVGESGRVVAFEPVLATAGCVVRTAELNHFTQLTVAPFGLDAGSTVRVQQLPTVRGMADSTIPKGAWSERIFVTSFDAIWPSLSGGEPLIHGVKIDVQGMELEVLRGMHNTLCRFRPALIVEFHRGVDRAAVLDVLAKSGYRSKGVPIESVEDPACPEYLDDKSYLFRSQP